MRLLLDTHFLVWLAIRPDEWKAYELAVFDAASSRHVSAASIWEIRSKWNLFGRSGTRKGQVEPAIAVQVAHKFALQIEPLVEEDALATLDPPVGHRDPFDEMLLVQAQRLGARLLTRDRFLKDHPLAYHP